MLQVLRVVITAVTMIAAMTFVKFTCSISSGGLCKSSKRPSVCSLFPVLGRGLWPVRENGLAGRGLPTAVAIHCVVCDEID